MTDLTKAAQAVVTAWKAGELGLGIKEFSALEAALAAQQTAQPVAFEPFGIVTTHTVTGQHFYFPEGRPPYLDTAKECIRVYRAAAQPQQAAPP